MSQLPGKKLNLNKTLVSGIVRRGGAREKGALCVVQGDVVQAGGGTATLDDGSGVVRVRLTDLEKAKPPDWDRIRVGDYVQVAGRYKKKGGGVLVVFHAILLTAHAASAEPMWWLEVVAEERAAAAAAATASASASPGDK